MDRILPVLLVWTVLVAPIGSWERQKSDPSYLKTGKDAFYTRAWVLASEEHSSLIVLVGVVHIGEPGYYLQIRDILEGCQEVFFEGLHSEEGLAEGPKISPAMAKTTAPNSWQGLQNLQMEYAQALGLVYQNSVIRPKRHWKNADASVRDFSRWVEEYEAENLLLDKKNADDEYMDIRTLKSQKNNGIQGIMKFRRKLAEEISKSSHSLNTEREYESTLELLVKRRNQVALRKIEASLGKGVAIGLIYGAAHMPDFLERLHREWGYQIVNHRWIPAWSLN